MIKNNTKENENEQEKSQQKEIVVVAMVAAVVELSTHCLTTHTCQCQQFLEQSFMELYIWYLYAVGSSSDVFSTQTGNCIFRSTGYGRRESASEAHMVCS